MNVELLGETVGELYENAPCGLLATDVAGRILRVNQTFLDWTGYDWDDLNGRPFTELLDHGNRQYYETRCMPVLHLDGEMREVALHLRRPDGTTLPILVNSTLQSSPDGEPESIQIAIFDASRRQNYERDLLMARRVAERSEAQVRLLQEASVALGAVTSEVAVVAALAEIAKLATAAADTVVMLLEPDTGGFGLATSARNPLGDVVLGDPRPESDALRFGRSVSIRSCDDAQRRYPAVVPMMREAHLEAVSVIPIPRGEAPMGVLACFYERPRDADDDVELELLEALAGQAAQALERIRLQRQLLNLAMHDDLTGLANRQMLEERLEQVLSASRRHGRPMALIFLDLDGFKAINDGLGHVVGDGVLVEVADRLKKAVRRSDTVARFGGDEFIVLCEDADARTATEVAERIRRSIAGPLDGVSPEYPLTASVGVACHPGGMPSRPSTDAVVLAADAAMYRSKADGKNRHTLVTV